MAEFCIVPELAAKLKAAAKTGDITMQKLFEMSDEDGVKLFEKYTDHETASQIHEGFKQGKESLDNQLLKQWLQNTFSSKDKAKPQYKDLITKINDLRGKITPETEENFFKDALSEKLGVTISAEEAKHIDKLAGAMEKESGKISKVGTKTLEWYQAKKEMDNYVLSRTPMSNLRVFTSTIGRSAMLASVHSPLLNIVSNAVIGSAQIAERKATTGRLQGLNGDFAKEYRKFATEVYSKTGYDLSRFQSFGEQHKVRGEDMTHSQGDGKIHAVGRFYEDIFMNKMQGYPDVRFASFHFTDSANLASSALAIGEGLKGDAAKARALEIMKDAFKEIPQSKIGQFVRAQGEADALYATFTNDSMASRVALSFRGIANTATGDLRLGDITDPFVKTPANVIAAGLDYAGVTLTAKLGTGIVKTLIDVAHRESFDKENFADINKHMIRAGMGLTFAYLISQMIQPKDFIGQYPTSPTEQKLFDERNGIANSIRIGNSWVSLDYLSVFGAPLLGLLYAKKYSQGKVSEGVYDYGKGIEATLQNLPGVETIVQAWKDINTPPSRTETAQEAELKGAKAFIGAFTSRIIPGIVNDIANMTDQYQRTTDKNSLTAATERTLPHFREGLPIQKDIFGTDEKSEPWISTLLFGSRVKTANDSELISELVRLNSQGELPSITDVSRSSKQAKDLRTQIGDSKFNEAMQYFGNNLKQNMTETIKSDEYKTADSALEQKKMLDKVKTQTLKDMLDTYGYEKPVKE